MPETRSTNDIILRWALRALRRYNFLDRDVDSRDMGREPTDQGATLTPLDLSDPTLMSNGTIPARVTDISPIGLCLELAEPLATELFLCELDTAETREVLLVRTVNSRPGAQGRVRCGAQILDRFDPDDETMIR